MMMSDLMEPDTCDALAFEISKAFDGQRKGGLRPRGGLRNVLQLSPLAASIAVSAKIKSVVNELLCGESFPARAIFFDKTDDANWGVPWHQDLAITVAERIATPGFGPWSVKDGVIHVQPHISILESMLTVRLHLDDCCAENGALRVLRGSHLAGELSSDDICRLSETGNSVTCEMRKGGALLMRPLLLHASSPAKNPSHRRVLHVEYSKTMLPNGLKWSENS